MFKGIYVCNEKIDDLYSGVSKKINMQVTAFRQLGFSMELPNLFDYSKKDRIIRRIPFLKSGFEKNLEKYIKKNWNEISPDFIYVRNVINDSSFLKALKKISQNGTLIIYEFPTFPYDKNSRSIKWKLLILKEFFSRLRLKKYVSKGVNYSEYDKIFGIDCIKISNGIDPDLILPQKPMNKDNKKIVFLGVALLTYWNGYDRLMKAIANYYSDGIAEKRKIIFNIVGDGEELSNLKKISSRLGVEKYVKFYGFVSGEALDRIYDQTDIAVGTLASFRKYKGHTMSTLKTKEYTAKGIPFIKCDPDVVFDNNYVDFCYNVSPDENLICLEEIIQWYDKLKDSYGGNQGLINHIREFAYEKLMWKKQLIPIVDYINNVLNERNIPKENDIK